MSFLDQVADSMPDINQETMLRLPPEFAILDIESK
jgi:hypothetical protein